MKTKKAAARKSGTKSISSKSAGKSAKSGGPNGPPAHGVTPYLIVKDAAAAIVFYAKILGAREKYRLVDPSGKVGHAELALGDGRIFLADEFPSFGAMAPPSVGGTPVGLHLYVADVDAVIKRAEAAGALVLRPAADQFYGDRAGMIADPFGHHWYVATRQRTVSPRQMQKIYSAMFTEHAKPESPPTSKTGTRKRLVHS